jgi:hypothetical protein
MIKSTIFLSAILVVLNSCKNEVKTKEVSFTENSKFELTTQNVNDSNNKIIAVESLTKDQINNFFPKEISAYKLINVSTLKSNAIFAGTYIKGNDYNNSLTYTLEDGSKKGSAILKNFEISYASDLIGPEGTEYIKIERGDYKTIAFLQPKINRNNVSFIYFNRFKLTMEGSEHPDVLWTYFKNFDLEKLDNY